MNKAKIHTEITKLEKPYPEDNLILSYKDFLIHRDNLHYFQFNPNVFRHLIELATKLWMSDKRISRQSLIQTLDRYFSLIRDNRSERKGYYDELVFKSYTLDYKISKTLFQFVKFVLENIKIIPKAQLEIINQKCNSLLINLRLSRKEELWLLENYTKIPFLLNRIFYYPTRSKTFSDWAKHNIDNPSLSINRSQLTGLILNFNRRYEFDLKQMGIDFEHLNKMDAKLIEDYEFHCRANEIMLRDLDLHKSSNLSREDFQTGFLIANTPSLELSKRSYYPLMSYYTAPGDSYTLVDFDKSRENFYNAIEVTRDITMLWSIYYSRLDLATQFEISKKYCTISTVRTAFKIFSRSKNIQGLKWLAELI